MFTYPNSKRTEHTCEIETRVQSIKFSKLTNKKVFKEHMIDISNK